MSMTLSDQFRSSVEGRKAGRVCPIEHGEWTPLDTEAVKKIQTKLRKLYWASKKQMLLEAYIQAEELKPLVGYLPYQWRLPEQVKIARYASLATVDLLDIVERAPRAWLESVRK